MESTRQATRYTIRAEHIPAGDGCIYRPRLLDHCLLVQLHLESGKMTIFDPSLMEEPITSQMCRGELLLSRTLKLSARIGMERVTAVERCTS